jgi:GT2 family glycosyltransferase
MKPLYVVILNWNLKEETIACISSVLAAGAPIEHIIVVDNGSTDDSVEAIADLFGSALPLITNPENLGFAGGINGGIQYALRQGATSVLILNNDTVVDAQMIQTLLEAADNLGDVGILGPAIYYYDDPERLWRLGDIQHRWLPMPMSVRLRGDKLANSPPFQVDYVTGCGMLIHREVFEHIGLFDTRYFMYFEDADFCRRARDAGHSVWCVPSAKMWHKVSLTAKREKSVNRYHRAFNQVRFYREHEHGPSPWLRDGYLFMKVITTTLADVLHRDWDLIHPLWKGTWDGYTEQRAQD